MKSQFVAVLFTLVISSFGYTQDLEVNFASETYLRVGIPVDETITMSSLYLSLHLTEIKKDLDNLPGALKEDGYTKCYLSLIRCIQNNDPDGLSLLLLDNANQDTPSEEAVNTAKFTIKALFDIAKKVSLVYICYFGDTRIFSTKFTIDEKFYYVGFSICKKNDAFFYMGMLSTTEDKFIARSLEYADRENGVFVTLNDLPVNLFQISLNKEPSKYSAMLHVNAKICETGNLFSDKLDLIEPLSEDPVINFYSQAIHVFYTRPPEEYASIFSPLSKKKVLQGFQNVKGDEFVSFRKELPSVGHYAKFMINADPVYIVFYQNKFTGLNTYKYDWILRIKDNSYLLCNYYMESLIDDIFRNKELFVHPLLAALEKK